MTPATGPSTSAGSMRTAMTPPNAAPLAAEPDTWSAANVDVASRPSQSPSEERPRTAQRRRNARTDSTVRTPENPDIGVESAAGCTSRSPFKTRPTLDGGTVAPGQRRPRRISPNDLRGYRVAVLPSDISALRARYDAATADLDPPFAIVDLAAFDANATAL